MKFIEAAQSTTGLPTIELTRRNLEILLAKLDDPLSNRTISKSGHAVHAVENDAHYADREPGAMYLPSTGETL